MKAQEFQKKNKTIVFAKEQCVSLMPSPTFIYNLLFFLTILFKTIDLFLIIV